MAEVVGAHFVEGLVRRALRYCPWASLVVALGEMDEQIAVAAEDRTIVRRCSEV